MAGLARTAILIKRVMRHDLLAEVLRLVVVVSIPCPFINTGIHVSHDQEQQVRGLLSEAIQRTVKR